MKQTRDIRLNRYGATPYSGSESDNRQSTGERKPGILMVGNLFSLLVGASSVSASVAECLEAEGWTVVLASMLPARVPRLADMLLKTLVHFRKYDVAHVDVFSGKAFFWAHAVSNLLWILRKPFVLTLRGGDLPRFSREHASLVRRVLSRASAVTVPSGYLMNEMKPYRSDLILIPNPIDLPQYTYRARTAAQPRLVWLRAFHGIYNPAMAVRVVERLVGEYPATTLVMYGRDKEDGSLRSTRAAIANGLARDHVQIMGPVAKQEVPSALDQSDFFLNTSTIDNTPVSVLEAMACGLIVVSTNVGGMPFLLEHEKDGLMVDSDDAQSMADAVRRVLRDPALARQLSSNARAKAESFQMKKIVPSWAALFTALARGKRM
jgi:glycosyltransferase involved in cell wall biosynthesis